MTTQEGAAHGGGEGVPLGQLVSESDGRSADCLRARHGDAFLVFAGRVEELKSPARAWQVTMTGEARRAGERPGFSVQTALVWRIVHTERTISPRFVSVGRLGSTNDVVINDQSVSACHAVFEPVAEGRYIIRDMGSKNGTFVNDRPVPKGQTRDITPGDVLRLGAVRLMFLDAEKLADLLRLSSRVR